MNLASLLAKRTFRVKGRNHVWCLTSLLSIILLPKTYIFISESGKLGNYWRKKSGLKKQTPPPKTVDCYHAVWLLEAHPESRLKLEKETECFSSQNTPASNFLHSVPPLWYQQGNERMSHKLSLFELIAAHSVNQLCVCEYTHTHTRRLCTCRWGKWRVQKYRANVVNLSDVFIPNTWPYVVNSKAAGGEEPGHSRCTLTASIKDVGMWKKRINTHSRRQTTHVVGMCVCSVNTQLSLSIPFATQA